MDISTLIRTYVATWMLSLLSALPAQYPLVQTIPAPAISMVEPSYKVTTVTSGVAKFTVTSPVGIKSVKVNGAVAKKESNNQFSHQYVHNNGINTFTVVATDTRGVSIEQVFRWQLKVELPYHVPILEFHHVGRHATNSLYQQPELFEEQMKYLRDNGYHSITFAQLNDNLLRGKKLPAKAIIISFDDGYYDVYSEAFSIMKKYGMVGVIGVITGKVEPSTTKNRYYLSWSEIQELDKAGFEMVSHSVNHKDLSKLSDAELTVEVRDSKTMLEQKLGKVVKTMIYPYGAVSNNVVSKLKEFGYEAGRINILNGHPAKDKIFYLPAIGLYKDMGKEYLRKALESY